MNKFTKEDMNEAFKAGMKWQDYVINYKRYSNTNITIDDFKIWFEKYINNEA